MNDQFNTLLPSLLLEADLATKDGLLDKAHILYSRILEDSPDSLDARIGLEYVSYLKGNFNSRYGWGNRTEDPSLRLSREANRSLLESEFQKKKVRLKSLPVSILIEHTTRCNFYCPHCSKGYDPYFADDMPEDVMNQAVDKLLPTMMWACITSFGEPTISPRYPSIMQKLVTGDVIPQFNTNTSTLTIPHIDALVRSRARVVLSIDGATKNTFETIRAGGKWERLQYVLHAIRRIRRIIGGDSWFDVTFVAMRTNIHELPEIVKLVHQYELDHLTVQDYLGFGSAYDQNSLQNDPALANHYLEEAEKQASLLRVTMYCPPKYDTMMPPTTTERSIWKRILDAKRILPASERFPQRCRMPWQFMNVAMNGDITPCCNIRWVMGNLTEDPIKKIWNGWRYRILRFFIESPIPPLGCRTCHVYEGINKGNPGNSMAKEGLLIKLLYKFALRVEKYLESRFSIKKDCIPNYHKGKPVKMTSELPKEHGDNV